MPRPVSIAVSAGLIVMGSVACALTSPILLKNKDLDVPLNVMGINRSPYGEVFAMAMQSPIDDYFHIATNGQIHGHGEDEHCEHCDHDHEAETSETAGTTSLKGSYRSMLTSLSNVRTIRTNPNPASPKFKFHLRRETEDKLRFAYQLDPSHYANYNALHFFLTEPQFGTRPELTPSAATLAHETVNYCLNRTDDPRPALTAAAACTNILHLMFADRNTGSTRHSTAEMRQILQLLDFSIARYQTIAREWEASGQWKNLSQQRTQECLERYEFIMKIRNAAEKAILAYETPSPASQETN